MSRYEQGHGGRYDGSEYDSGLQGQKHPRDIHDRMQQQHDHYQQQQQRQQARSAGQRSHLPSQQRAAAQSSISSGHADRRQQQRSMQPAEHGPQWPLRDDNVQPSTSGNQRGPPPPRPPRPGQVPMALSIPKPASNRGPSPLSIPQYRPDHASLPAQYVQQDTGDWQDEEYGSPTYPAPNLSRPLTGSSRGSTSSNYSVPDFPVPQIPQQIVQNQSQFRRPPLGPPPSARRGPSSYYPQMSLVPPIVEETDSIYSQSTRAQHDSYASSNAIPIGIPGYYLDDRDAPLTDDESPFEEAYEEESPIEHVQEVNVVPMRQASIGRRSRPTMTTIKSNDTVRPDSQTRPLSTKASSDLSSPISPTSDTLAERPTEDVPMVPLVPGLFSQAVEDNESEKSVVHLAGGTDSSRDLDRSKAIPDSSSESEKSLKQKRSRELLAAARDQVRTRSPLAQGETSVESGHTSSEKATTSTLSEKLNTLEQKGSLSQRVGSRRPPPLNVDATKEAEARGSLTSLPDLIARATRLASNLDRGRTASRLGMDWFGDEHKSQGSWERRKSGNSLSDILASFPPPGLATPGSRGSRSMAQWPSHLRHSALASDSDASEAQPRKRRCCGMPLWLFVLLLLLLLLIVAAAVVVPVVLVVLPRQHMSPSTSAKALAACHESLSCQNGGTNIVGTDGSCSCLCVNGYTGSQCTVKSTTGCATTSTDRMSDVTVGEAIPRLLEAAQSNFTVPLNSSTILGMFSANNLSCASENALVTFNGLAARSVDTERLYNLIPTSTLKKRQVSTSETAAAATSNGIVFDSTPSSTASSSSASATTTLSVSPASSNSTMIDFARVAVLFVMQDSGKFDTAVSAQENLQDYFTSGSTSAGQTIDATNVTLASGYTANLEAHTITTAGGSSVGD